MSTLDYAGVNDQGQISRMMKRLSDQRLVENTQAHTKRQARAWRLISDGEAVIDAHKSLKQAQRRAGKGGRRRGTRTFAATGPTSRADRSRRNPDPLDREDGRRAFRMTALTGQVLTAIAYLGERGANPSNREIAQAAGVKDQGQISKLLARLQTHGLLENTGGLAKGANAWRLTPRGEEILSASRPRNMATPGGAQR